MSKIEQFDHRDPLEQALLLQFAEKLRSIRREQHLSQECLGYMIGSQHPRVSNFESGFVTLNSTDFVKIVRALNVHPAELLDLTALDPKDYPERPPNGHALL